MLSTQHRLIELACRAPVWDPDQVFAAIEPEATVFWAPRQGHAVVGAGIAAELRASGADRFERIRAAAEPTFGRLQSGEAGLAPPRFWGGFSFAVGGAARVPWSGFGDARFVLPAITYELGPSGAWLRVAGAEAPDVLRERLALTLARLAGRIACGVPPAGGALAGEAVRRNGVAPAVWREQIETLLGAIAAGRVAKVVAAQRTEVTLTQRPATAQLLARLSAETGGVWRFALRCGAHELIGATPERLVARHGARVRTEALAGTLKAGQGDAAELMASAKDRGEHEFVRATLVEALAPLCRDLLAPPVPEVRALRGLLHLATPVEAELREPRHVLDLVARLHPTPAVGGMPRAAALALIAATEPVDRGWYAGPVGWFDAAGDGEFVVALRSGLIGPDAAWLYAGAGVVAGSDPERERLEVELKQTVMLRALGLC